MFKWCKDFNQSDQSLYDNKCEDDKSTVKYLYDSNLLYHANPNMLSVVQSFY